MMTLKNYLLYVVFMTCVFAIVALVMIPIFWLLMIFANLTTGAAMAAMLAYVILIGVPLVVFLIDKLADALIECIE